MANGDSENEALWQCERLEEYLSQEDATPASALALLNVMTTQVGKDSVRTQPVQAALERAFMGAASWCLVKTPIDFVAKVLRAADLAQVELEDDIYADFVVRALRTESEQFVEQWIYRARHSTAVKKAARPSKSTATWAVYGHAAASARGQLVCRVAAGRWPQVAEKWFRQLHLSMIGNSANSLVLAKIANGYMRQHDEVNAYRVATEVREKGWLDAAAYETLSDLYMLTGDWCNIEAMLAEMQRRDIEAPRGSYSRNMPQVAKRMCEFLFSFRQRWGLAVGHAFATGG
eukprot:2314521-Amphidinium_carterae.1